MGQGSTSRVQLASMKEATWGEIPGTVVLKEKNVTSVGLGYNKITRRSRVLRRDRQQPSIVKTGASAAGRTPSELLWGGFNDWLLSALFATDTNWTTPFSYTGAGSSGDVQFIASGNHIVAAGANFASLKAGQLIRVKSAAQAGNNGVKTIASVVSATDITTVETLTNENSSSAVISASMIRNGTTQHSFLHEVQYSDIGVYEAFPGSIVDSFKIDAMADEIVAVDFDWLCKRVIADTSTLDSANGYDAAVTGDPLNATSNVGTILKGGSALGTLLEAIKLEGKNKLRGRRAIGHEFNASVGDGTFELTGELTAYFEDLTLRNHMLNHDPVAVHYRFTDALGNLFAVTLPRIKSVDGNPDVPGQDDDVMLPWQFEAERDPVTDCMIQFDKLAA